MTDSIGETENVGEASVPRNIGKLLGVDKDKESDEYGRKTSIKKFSE